MLPSSPFLPPDLPQSLLGGGGGGSVGCADPTKIARWDAMRCEGLAGAAWGWGSSKQAGKLTWTQASSSSQTKTRQSQLSSKLRLSPATKIALRRGLGGGNRIESRNLKKKTHGKHKREGSSPGHRDLKGLLLPPTLHAFQPSFHPPPFARSPRQRRAPCSVLSVCLCLLAAARAWLANTLPSPSRCLPPHPAALPPSTTPSSLKMHARTGITGPRPMGARDHHGRGAV